VEIVGWFNKFEVLASLVDDAFHRLSQKFSLIVSRDDNINEQGLHSV